MSFGSLRGPGGMFRQWTLSEARFSFSVFGTLRGRDKVRTHLARPCSPTAKPSSQALQGYSTNKLVLTLHKHSIRGGASLCREERPLSFPSNSRLWNSGPPWLCYCLEAQGLEASANCVSVLPRKTPELEKSTVDRS